jgi:serine phosphatase RsbU (regulator of sigma subunit)
LEIGHQIQTGFLPEVLPQKSGWFMGAFFRPAREVAGDFYDSFELPDGKIALILGDVADKGVGSALFMALYRSLLRSALNNPMLLDQPGSKLIRAVTHTNDYVCTTHDDALFATIFAGILDPTSGEITYVNAGHNPPMLIQGKKESWILPTGPAVGMLDGQTYLSKKVVMDLGDRLFIYSDGLEDVKNGQDEFYDRERLAASFVENESSIESIVAQIDRFMMNEQQYDDLSLLIVERKA